MAGDWPLPRELSELASGLSHSTRPHTGSREKDSRLPLLESSLDSPICRLMAGEWCFARRVPEDGNSGKSRSGMGAKEYWRPTTSLALSRDGPAMVRAWPTVALARALGTARRLNELLSCWRTAARNSYL